MSERLVVAAQPETAKSSSTALVILFIGAFCLCLGVIGGFLLHRHLENSKQYERYVGELEPLLYYKDRVHSAKDRGSNEIMRVVNYKIYQADHDGLNIEKLLVMAQPKNKQPPVLAELNRKRILENLQLAKDYGIFEGSDNMKRMATGNSPYITKGEFAGQRIDVEHLVPKNLAPSLDNILANLMWLPQSLNASKSDNVTEEVLWMAEIFKDQNILPMDEYLKIKEDTR